MKSKRVGVRLGYGLAALLSAALACVACMPNAMRIDRARDPQHQDQQVRFRATYYFRVYDYCRDDAGEQIVADGLYRFRMTGKAHALSNRTRFESGSMLKNMIEPFGCTIDYDEDTGEFSHQSCEAGQADQRRTAQLEMAGKFMQVGKSDPALLQLSMAAALREVVAAAAPAAPHSTRRVAVDDDDRLSQLRCGQLARGFQILGPEGWREFNQDERLVLAMSSNGKPLISMLKELSGRILNNQIPPAEFSAAFSDDELKVSRAEMSLDRVDTGDPAAVDAALTAAIESLVADEEGEP